MKLAGDIRLAEGKASSYRWVVIITWMVAHIWGFITIESLGFLLPSMREELGLTPIQEGLLGGAPLIGVVFLAIPSSLFLSRLSPKRLTTITLLIGAGLLAFQGWAPVFGVLLVGRFLFGLSTVAREPARALLMRQWIQLKEIVVANASMNLLWGVSAVSFIFIPIILELLDDSWRNTIYLFAAISLGLTLAWQVIGKERITREYASDVASTERSLITSIFRYKELWLIGIGVVGIDIGFGALAVFWPSYMLDTYDFSLQMTAVIWAISGLASAVSALGVSLIAQKTGKRRPFLTIAGVFITLTTIGMLFTGYLPYLVLLAIAQGLAFSIFPILMTIPFELPNIKPREIAVANGFIETFFVAGAMLGPVLAGGIQQISDDLRLALIITSVCSLTLTATGIMLPKEVDRPKEQPAPQAA
ncbi:MAG: MFS transporter [Dehalococcoidia bacterium]